MAGSDSYFHNATFGVDYKDFRESVRPSGADKLNTPIDYLGFTASYRATQLRNAGRGIYGVGVNFGVRGLGNEAREFEDKRFNAVPNYFYATAFTEQDYTLGAGFVLYGALNAQVADSPLVSNEQFSAGGADSVRGYFESQALGDDGVRGSVEVRSPSLAGYASSRLHKLEFFAFLDGAKLRTRDPLPGQPVRTTLYGAGAGLRVDGLDGFDADFSLAWPLRDNGSVNAGDLRSHFRVHYGF